MDYGIIQYMYLKINYKDIATFSIFDGPFGFAGIPI